MKTEYTSQIHKTPMQSLSLSLDLYPLSLSPIVIPYLSPLSLSHISPLSPISLPSISLYHTPPSLSISLSLSVTLPRLSTLLARSLSLSLLSLSLLSLSLSLPVSLPLTTSYHSPVPLMNCNRRLQQCWHQ